MSQSKLSKISFWIVTGLFCLWMAFTAFAQLKLPQVAEAFRQLGFPGYFRVELSWAKFIGIAALLFPVPARIKEWADAGFGIVCISAFIAHLSVGQGAAQWLWAPAAFVVLTISYILRQRIEVTGQA